MDGSGVVIAEHERARRLVVRLLFFDVGCSALASVWDRRRPARRGHRPADRRGSRLVLGVGLRD
jgi:hypothetical protein